MTAPALLARAPAGPDVPAIIALFEQSFGRPISEGHYHWKLRSRPAPVENAVILTDPEGRVVFHSAGIPCKARIAGIERDVMLGCDVMTDSAWRRQGLNSAYSSAMYQRWKDAGVALVIGFTNSRWGSSATNVGLRPLAPLASLVLPLRPERVLARRARIPAIGRLGYLGRLWRAARFAGLSPAGHDVREVLRAGEEFDALWTNAASRISHSLVHDREWINWRYLSSPDVPYRVWLARRDGTPVGYAALATGNRESPVIADIFTAPGDGRAFSALLRAVCDAAVAGGAESIRALAVPGSWPFGRLRRAGFRVRSTGMIEHILLDPEVGAAVAAPPAGWQFMAGDFDAV